MEIHLAVVVVVEEAMGEEIVAGEEVITEVGVVIAEAGATSGERHRQDFLLEI